MARSEWMAASRASGPNAITALATALGPVTIRRMKNVILLVALILGCAVVLPALAADASAQKPKPTKQAKADTARLFHVVSLKFKDTATKDQIKAVEEAFRALKKKITAINSLRWGTNVSPEKHDKGFTHCFILTFANEKDRDTYLNHPDHVAFGKILGPVMADVFVLDFKSKKT